MYIIDRLDEVPDGIVMSVSVYHSDGHCPLIFVVGDGFIQEYETPLIDRYIAQWRELTILSDTSSFWPDRANIRVKFSKISRQCCEISAKNHKYQNSQPRIWCNICYKISTAVYAILILCNIDNYANEVARWILCFYKVKCCLTER